MSLLSGRKDVPFDRDDSFTRFFRQHAEAVRRHVYGIVSAVEIAEELTQEAFARVYVANTAELKSPSGFLLRVAHNLALDHIRRRKRVHIEPLGDDAARWLRDDAPSAEEQLATREELHHVRAAVAELPPKCRQVFLLLRIEGLSYREIALEMGLSPTMVRKYADRAFEHLQLRLGRRHF